MVNITITITRRSRFFLLLFTSSVHEGLTKGELEKLLLALLPLLFLGLLESFITESEEGEEEEEKEE